MAFTATTPARFINERQVNGVIFSVASERLRLFTRDRRLIESEEVVLDELVHLARAAHVVHGACLRNAREVREALFSRQALDLIKIKCRNRYWLWFLLKELATDIYPVPVLAIARAHARAKKSISTNHFGFAFVKPIDLIWQLKGMPPGFVLKLWDTGLILSSTRDDGNGYSIVLNPLLIDD